MNIAVLGATGRTGKIIVNKALEAGHAVRALARDPEKLGLRHDRLTIVQGDASDADAVRRLVDGVDSVVSALGPTPSRKDICSAGTANVLACHPKRYVVVSGAGIDVPGDRKDLGGKIASRIIRWLTPAEFNDKVREHALLQDSAARWVLVRPPRLLDGPPKRPTKVSLERALSTSISREALAAFVLQCAAEGGYERQAPFVSA